MQKNLTFSGKSKKARGFALIVTIVLVAFLVLILVGLATFTRVETQVADNTETLSRARQNALAGLNIAVGQLQRHAGRDERVTARADLVGGVGPGNQSYFTGVWNTDGGALGATPDAWLVSGTEGTASPTAVTGIVNPDVAVTQPYDDDARTVFVVYNASVGTAVADRPRRVHLRKQEINVPAASLPGFASSDTSTPAIGHYAYWVGDEGVKVSIAVTPPDLSTLNYNNRALNGGLGGDNWSITTATATSELGDYLRARLSQFAQPYRRIDEFYPGIDYTVGNTTDELGRITSLEQLMFVTNSVADGATKRANFRARYHDMTPMARGVLARTDAGNSATTDRLRRDWSAQVLPPATGAGATTGINDYWVARPVSISTTSGEFAAVYDITGRKATAGSALAFSVAPVLSEAGLFLAFGTEAGGQLILRTALLAEFWNPYAATLRTQNASTLKLVVRTAANVSVEFRATDNVGTEHTITIPADPAGTVIAEAEVPGGQNFVPGRILQMQTTPAGVFATAGAGAADTTFSSGVTATLPITTCNLPLVNAGDLIIELQENSSGSWVTFQTFELDARVAEPGVPPGTPYFAGYGFELSRNLALWSDPRTTNARDPRAADFVAADHFEPLNTTTNPHWEAEASTATNPSGIAGEAPFANGGSLVLFDLPRQEITSVAQLRHLAGDLPYEIIRGAGAANADDQSLFDATFVSTVPRNVATWDFATQARPNRYLEVYSPPGAPAGEFDSAANRLTSLRHEARSARYQLIRGAFNINSTSVAAWSAVLGSSLADWDTQEDAPEDVNRAFFRVAHGAQEKGVANLVRTDAASGDPDKLADATSLSAVGRRLTEAEIDTLADRIVNRLIARGRPFRSLAEFLDSGLLADAIALANLNNDIDTPEFRHAAGAITPGDIVAAIAPFMAARSDTFKVRAYGDVRDPITEVVTGRAWCEAIVQRVPDLAEAPDAAANDVVRANPATYPFGRQFKIVSFRWLSPDDL